MTEFKYEIPKQETKRVTYERERWIGETGRFKFKSRTEKDDTKDSERECVSSPAILGASHGYGTSLLHQLSRSIQQIIGYTGLKRKNLDSWGKTRRKEAMACGSIAGLRFAEVVYNLDSRRR